MKGKMPVNSLCERAFVAVNAMAANKPEIVSKHALYFPRLIANFCILGFLAAPASADVAEAR
jgi:hypothetical protein